ncbi:MAG: hypothetical protein AMXMBFR82_40450 [Candidatus Hydrogenedentota bacterium]
MANASDKGKTLAGITVLLSLFTGVTAYIVGLLAVFYDLNFGGAGACFIASALSFGLAANAVLRG